MILRELRKVLIDIKDNGDRDDQRNGEEIGTDKLAYDIPVNLLDIPKWIKVFQYL